MEMANEQMLAMGGIFLKKDPRTMVETIPLMILSMQQSLSTRLGTSITLHRESRRRAG